MAKIDLWLDEEDVRAANTSGQFTFIVPDDASRRGSLDDPNDDKAKANWTQRIEIVESKVYEDVSKDRQGNEYPAVCVEVKFQVPPDAVRGIGLTGGADPNAGKATTSWYRVIPAALKNKQHPRYKANNYALGRLNGILRGIWGTSVFPHGQKVNLGDFFGGDPAPVVGKMVVANMRQSKWEGERRDELTDFVPLELT